MYLLFDIGGTTLRLAGSRDGKTIAEMQKMPTPADFEEGMAVIAEAIAKLTGNSIVLGMAGGAAGALAADKKGLANSPNLPGWVGQNLAGRLQQISGAPVFLENDALLGGLGEAVFGAGREYPDDIIVYVTVSTGVNGIRVVCGQVEDSAWGFEIGHQIIGQGGIPCPSCGYPGHLEGYISGSALHQKYGLVPSEITDLAVWDEVARYLAYGLNNIIMHWSPHRIILGGGVVLTTDLSLEAVERHLREAVKIFPGVPTLAKAELGDDSGLYGALALLRQKNIRSL